MERTDDLDEIIEIRDPEINVAEIMARIRENLAKREPLAPEVDSLVFDPGLGGFISVEEGIKQSLQQANLVYDKVYVGDQIRPTAGLKDRLASPLRRPLHNLVRFYVDILSSKQVAFNSSAVRFLNAITEKLERGEKKSQEELEQLRAELAELRETVEQLRCKTTGEGRGRREERQD